MTPDVDPAERITRFLRHGSQMRRDKMQPHYKAYLPASANGCISVYRTVNLSGVEIVDLGAQHVERPEAPLKGYCCLPAATVFGQGLDVEFAPVPHVRHANISGWESDPRNRIIARALADSATLTEY